VELELLISEFAVQLDLGVSFFLSSRIILIRAQFLESPPVKSDQANKIEVVAYLKNFLRSTCPLILVGYSGSDEF
jgi:hypothetical protein